MFGRIPDFRKRERCAYDAGTIAWTVLLGMFLRRKSRVRMDSDSFYFDDSTKIIVNGENASRIDAEALELIVEQTFTMEGEKKSGKGDLFDPHVNRIIIIVSAIGSLIVTGLLIFVILKRFFSEKKKKAAAEEKAQEDSLNDDDYYDANE